LAIGQQAEVPHLDKPAGQDVLHEATQELIGVERHRLLSVSGGGSPTRPGGFQVVMGARDLVSGQRPAEAVQERSRH
jgi:hypothetical protein